MSSMGTQKHLDIDFICPLSSVKINGRVTPVHKMAVLQCSNGVLFARCPHHLARCFIADHTTVKEIMQTSIVVRVTHKEGKKEGNNAAS